MTRSRGRAFPRLIACMIVLAGSSGHATGKEGPSAAVPAQEIFDAVFRRSLPPPRISLSRTNGGSVDQACGLATTDLAVSRGDSNRVYNILVKAPDRLPLRPTQAFFRFRRLTVDADGSSRAYHPDDPLGTGICHPGDVKQACALDELSNAGIGLFKGLNFLSAHGHEQAEYLSRWSKVWSDISKKSVMSLNHARDSRVPEGYELFYFPKEDITAIFKSAIIPFSGGYPCLRSPTDKDPGYFVAATTLKKFQPPANNACDPRPYLDASVVPFIVLPGGAFGGLAIGDIAIGFARSGAGDRTVFGIVGDAGPHNKIAEGSIAFNSLMMRRREPLSNSQEQEKIDIDLSKDAPAKIDHITSMGVLVLGGTKVALANDYSPDNIARIGARLLKRWGGDSDPAIRLAACLARAPENLRTIP